MASRCICVVLLFLAHVTNLYARSLHAETHLPFHDLKLVEKQKPPPPAVLLGFSRELHTPSLAQLHTPLDFHDQESSRIAVQFSHADTRLSVPASETSFANHPTLEPDLSLTAVLSSIPSLLQQNGLPIGLLPSSIASYAITDDGNFIVCLQEACYVDFDHEVYYAPTITGKLTYGSITNLSGIQAKEAFFWVPVTAIRTDIPSSNFIYFNVGPISKKLPISQFETIPTCKAKSMLF